MVKKMIEVLIGIVLIELGVIGLLIIVNLLEKNSIPLFSVDPSVKIDWDTEFLYNECKYWENAYEGLETSLCHCDNIKDVVKDGRGNIVGVYYDRD